MPEPNAEPRIESKATGASGEAREALRRRQTCWHQLICLSFVSSLQRHWWLMTHRHSRRSCCQLVERVLRRASQRWLLYPVHHRRSCLHQHPLRSLTRRHMRLLAL